MHSFVSFPRTIKKFPALMGLALLVCLLSLYFARQGSAYLSATLWVTSKADSGTGSLREALSTAQPGDTILFNTVVFPPTNPATIFLLSELPGIYASGLTLDGSAAGVILDGSQMPNATDNCLVIENGQQVTIRGLRIINCRNSGIDVRDNVSGLTIGGDRSTGTARTGQGNVLSGNRRGLSASGANLHDFKIQGNIIGSDYLGTASLPNLESGIYLNNVTGITIGGAAELRNRISANGLYGIEISNGSDITVQGNYIGTNFNGAAALGNNKTGLLVTDSNNVVFKDNLVSGNGENGAYFDRVNHVIVQGNIAGATLSGTAALPNAGVGIGIKGTDILVGGSAGQGNLISGNLGWAGLEIRSSVSGLATARIQGNQVGTDLAGSAAIPNAGIGIYIDSASITLGGSGPGEGNLISGNGGTGIQAESTQRLAYSVTAIGNTVGANKAGNDILGNGANGMELQGVGQATISGNLVVGSGGNSSANGWAGIHISGAGSLDAQATLLNNRVGVDWTGQLALPNKKHGVYIENTNADIGGLQANEGNLISANLQAGIYVLNTTSLPFQANIRGNRIGTNGAGTASFGNGQVGIFILSMGKDRIEGNLISGNGKDGINIDGRGVTESAICNNTIGTDINGTHILGNGGNGVWVGDAALTAGDGAGCAGNLISGNTLLGLGVLSTGNLPALVRGNHIGTDPSGQQVMPNGSEGAWVEGVKLTFGGPGAGDRNLVCGNKKTGLVVKNLTSGAIQNNLFGVTADGSQDLANQGSGITLYQTQNILIFENVSSGNLVDGIALESGSTNNRIYHNRLGTDASGGHAVSNLRHGIRLSGGANHNFIYDNLIGGNQSGIVLNDTGTDYNQIYGNFIGVDASGLAALPNLMTGIAIDQGAFNTVGGTTAAARNLISGNGDTAISIGSANATGNIVIGNYIGVDQTGAKALGNGSAGIDLYNGAHANRIGGLSSAERNIISGNKNMGIIIGGQANRVLGNFLGTDQTGTQDLGNGKEAIVIHTPASGSSGQNEVIGNLISGNTLNGITILADDSVIQGNRIGTDITGQKALGNDEQGIYVSGKGNLIGGSSGQGNWISGNRLYGITLGIDYNQDRTVLRMATKNTIQGNFIGTNLEGSAALPNRWAGIYLSGQDNQIGGALPAQGNLISGNAHEGIVLGEGSLTTNNRVQGNRVGTDVTGLKPVPNADTGIILWAGVQNNLIGGDTAAAGNLVAYNRDLGIGVWQDDVAGEAKGNRIQFNTIFHNNSTGLRITANTYLANNNIYENGENRVLVRAGTITTQQVWNIQGKSDAYFIHYNCTTCELVVSPGASLTIGEGVKVYLDYGRALEVQGSLVIDGSPAHRARVTGPQDIIWPGDWKGIAFAPGSSGQIHSADITFALTGLDIKGTVLLENSTISGHQIAGIHVAGAGSLSLNGNTIGGNFRDPGDLTKFAFDINNETTTMIDARGTWWGQQTEPADGLTNGPVDTSQWRTTNTEDTNSTVQTWQSADLLNEGTHKFSITSINDLDWFRIPIMGGGRELQIDLTDLPTDYDLFLFGQLGGAQKYPGDIGDRRIKHIARITNTDEAQAIAQLEDIARVMYLGQYSSDDAGLDTGRLLRVSTNTGKTSERISYYVGDQAGWYYILVAGNNGAHDTNSTYTLTISTSYSAYSYKDIFALPVFPSVETNSPKQTLIVTNRDRLEKRYGLDRVDRLMQQAASLASLPDVNGDVIDVSHCDDLFPEWKECSSQIALAYSEWDQHPAEIEYARRASAAVKGLINAIRTSYPDLKYLVILGSDEIIPFWRAKDEVPIANESSYGEKLLPGKPVGAALAQRYFLTDDYFTQFSPLTWRDRELFLPDLAAGRLVETPEDMQAVMQAFITSPQITVNSALITGYDFMIDEAGALHDELSTLSPTMLDTNTWNTSDLQGAWFQHARDFVALNAHFSHYQALAASLDKDHPLLPQQIKDGLSGPPGSLIYSIGCHAGLSVPQGQAETGYDQDFVEVLAGKGHTFIGNTGYGFGDIASKAYSEALALSFLKNLKADDSVGQALARAKNDYYQHVAVSSFSPYDEKVLEEVTLYGLPMLKAQFPPQQLRADQLQHEQALQAEPCTVLPGPVQGGLVTQNVRCSFTPTQMTGMLPDTRRVGTYFEINGQSEVNMNQPIQPKTSVDISLEGQTAHGNLMEAGAYTTYNPFDPVISWVVSDRIEKGAEEPPFKFPLWTPSSWDVTSSIRTGAGLQQILTLIPAQYQPLTFERGIERVFDTLSYTVYYSSSDDWLPPFIWEVKPGLQANKAVVEVTVFDRSGIQRVAITYTQSDGTWQTVNLERVQTGEFETWKGILPRATKATTFFIQAVDTAGNVAVADNKSSYYTFPTWVSAFLYLPTVRR